MEATCPYCGKAAVQATGAEVYPSRRDLISRKFYVCWPCDARVGCHYTGEPLGTLANASCRQARKNAHQKFDRLWQQRINGTPMNRKRCYALLADHLGISVERCHIGEFDEKQCRRVVAFADEIARQLKNGGLKSCAKRDSTKFAKR